MRARASSQASRAGAFLHRLGHFHVAGGQGPEAAARLDRPAAEQDAAVDLGHHAADDDLRVLIGDEAAIGAGQPLPVIAGRDGADEVGHGRTMRGAGDAARGAGAATARAGRQVGRSLAPLLRSAPPAARLPATLDPEVEQRAPRQGLAGLRRHGAERALRRAAPSRGAAAARGRDTADRLGIAGPADRRGEGARELVLIMRRMVAPEIRIRRLRPPAGAGGASIRSGRRGRCACNGFTPRQA